MNQLSNIAKLTAMPELKRLDINNNRLREMSGLEGLSNLRCLNLKANLLVGFEEGLPEMENLHELDISFNNNFSKIKTLAKLANLENLRVLRIEKTPVVDSQNNSDYLFKITSMLPKLERINDLMVNTSVR